MKATTGIVRHMDDLGRVVIPKEIRRNCKIKEGDPLEIFVERTEDGRVGVMLVPYQVEKEIDWEKVAEAFPNLDKDTQHNLLLNLTRKYLDN